MVIDYVLVVATLVHAPPPDRQVDRSIEEVLHRAQAPQHPCLAGRGRTQRGLAAGTIATDEPSDEELVGVYSIEGMTWLLTGQLVDGEMVDLPEGRSCPCVWRAATLVGTPAATATSPATSWTASS